MKLAQYSHQCGPRNVCTWGSQQTCSYTHSTTCQILPVITTLALNWRASTGQMLVWDPVLKRTRPQMTACVRTRQIKGFTKDLLKCVWHLPVGNRIQARQAGVKITDVRLLQGDRSHTCRHTHTHTPCGVSIGSSRLVSDGGIWQVVRRWFLFFQKGKRLKAGGLIISSLLTETQDTIARMLGSPEAKSPQTLLCIF